MMITTINFVRIKKLTKIKNLIYFKILPIFDFSDTFPNSKWI
jgi:hypothetical protein